MMNFEVTKAAIRIAKQEGVLVSMDLASFEVYILKPFLVLFVGIEGLLNRLVLCTILLCNQKNKNKNYCWKFPNDMQIQ